MQLIPYKGSSEVVQGLLTGSVDFIVDGIAPSLPLIKSGQFRPLAKLNNRALPTLPELKPLSEASGLPIDEMSSWIGLVAPAGTPPAIVQKIHADVVRAMAGCRRRRPAGEGRHPGGDHDAGGVREILPRRGGTLDQGL